MPGYGMKPRMMKKGGEAKKKGSKQKRKMPMSPRPMERPELYDSDAAGAVERGNAAAKRFADEYESLMGARGYAKGGAVCRGGGKAERGTKFRGVM